MFGKLDSSTFKMFYCRNQYVYTFFATNDDFEVHLDTFCFHKIWVAVTKLILEKH